MDTKLGKDIQELYQIRISIRELCAIWEVFWNQFKQGSTDHLFWGQAFLGLLESQFGSSNFNIFRDEFLNFKTQEHHSVADP